MICFDFEGKIKKYNLPEEIIDHRRVLSKAVGILPETEGKHLPIYSTLNIYMAV